MEQAIASVKRKLEVKAYDPKWAELFAKEQAFLKTVFGNNVIQIDHIGSTSVENLAAKPIIDILIETSDLTEFDLLSKQLPMSEYELKGENGISGRRYIQKGGNARTHHIHAFQAGDNNLMRHRAFAMYLTEHPEVTNEYAQLKLNAAEQSGDDFAKYMTLKNEFIMHHEKLAVQWLQNRVGA